MGFILAGSTFAVAEHRFYGRLPAEVAERVAGVRRHAQLPRLHPSPKRFVDECYPAPLQLEVEEHEGRFDLLVETHVTVFPDGPGWVMHKSKDWARVQQGLSRRLDGGVETPGRSGRGVLIGTLLRADDEIFGVNG